MTTLLCINPNARNGVIDRAAIVASLEQIGPVMQCSQPVAQALSHGLLSNRQEVDRIVIGGGDGTINAALPALLEAKLPVGILPLGTANDFARALGVHQDLETALAVIIGGVTRSIDVGVVNDHYFVNAVGVGLGPRLTRVIDKEQKKRLGVLAYLESLMRVIGEKRRNRADIAVDGRRHHVRFLQITIACSPYYGGGLTVSPDNALNDGLLHLLALKPASPWILLKQGVRMRTGLLNVDEQSISDQGKQISIRTSRRCEVTADGELIGQAPVDCRLLKRALRVFVPRELEVAQ